MQLRLQLLIMQSTATMQTSQVLWTKKASLTEKWINTRSHFLPSFPYLRLFLGSILQQKSSCSSLLLFKRGCSWTLSFPMAVNRHYVIVMRATELVSDLQVCEMEWSPFFLRSFARVFRKSTIKGRVFGTVWNSTGTRELRSWHVLDRIASKYFIFAHVPLCVT